MSEEATMTAAVVLEVVAVVLGNKWRRENARGKWKSAPRQRCLLVFAAVVVVVEEEEGEALRR